MRWVILNVQTGDYWSNDWGWGGRAGATVFTSDEMRTLMLPIDGWWVPSFITQENQEN